jgi:CheY-like chemotaxis protein
MNGKKKILVLDDEGSIRDLMDEVLQGIGYEVITADNPSLTAIRAYKADAIILDLHMEDRNEKLGLDVLIHLWEDTHNDIPVIIFSAYAGFQETRDEIDEIERLYGKGRRVYDCICKSDGIQSLLGSIETLFEVKVS